MNGPRPGAIIRAAREARGWSMADLASHIEEQHLVTCSRQQVWSWEHDKCLPSFPSAVAKALGISVEHLVR